MANFQSGDSAIGYKRPPTNGRFVKGKSGNPKGRPRGARGSNTLADLINEPITVTIDGTRRQLPMGEALTLSLFQKALAGNVPAAREVMKIMEKVEAQQKTIEERPSITISRIIVDPKECNVPLQHLGVIEAVEDCWRIRTWVVEAALARNRHILLEGSDRLLLTKSMVDAKALEPLLLRSG